MKAIRLSDHWTKEFKDRLHAEILDRQKWAEVGKTLKEFPKDENPIITADTIWGKACGITIRAILTDIQASNGNEMMFIIYHDAVDFAQNPEMIGAGYGADLIQETALYLSRYMGKSLNAVSVKNGETLLRNTFRFIGTKISVERKRSYKHTYIEDYEKENGFIQIPFQWDVNTYEQWREIDTKIEKLCLTANQKQILFYRMRGWGQKKIAKVKGCSYQNVQKVMSQIQTKYEKEFGEIDRTKYETSETPKTETPKTETPKTETPKTETVFRAYNT